MRSGRPAITLVLALCLLPACASAGGDAPTSPASDTGSESAGGGSSPSEAATSGVGGDGADRRVDPRAHGLELGFGEFAITLEADEIRPGPVTFVIRNGGALVHGFEIEGEDDDGDHSGPGNGELKFEGPEFGPGTSSASGPTFRPASTRSNASSPTTTTAVCARPWSSVPARR